MVWENIAIYNRTQLHETCFGILGFSVGLPRIRLLICLLLFSWAQDNLLSRIRILTCITLFWPTPLVHAHIFFQCKQDHKFRTYGSQRMFKKKNHTTRLFSVLTKKTTASSCWRDPCGRVLLQASRLLGARIARNTYYSTNKVSRTPELRSCWKYAIKDIRF